MTISIIWQSKNVISYFAQSFICITASSTQSHSHHIVIIFYSGLAKQDQEKVKTALRDVSPLMAFKTKCDKYSKRWDISCLTCYVVAPGFDRLHR